MSDKKQIKTNADKIWDEIKNLNIDMFALPDQKVHQYCTPIAIDPNKLFLTSSVGSFLTALELILRSKYSVEREERFIVVTPIHK
ncbi:hypothetical protein UFOVP1290_566 [uncultured Caudovirales phage]|uniref:Uncharacterized protein n=1 Tax=uncultured Caudovirales phage TaxID=2100421 RepID=A0A6J5RS59_9CAUD|nr:hypothetical protein UFOVP1290_566 [uncultured Caudovirales phage]